MEVPVDYIGDGHLTHGYAATVHKTQGISCDSVLVLGDDTFTIETGYTSLTRAKLRNQLYLVTPESENGHGLGPELDPIASFTAALRRSDAKTAAIDVIDPPVLEP